MNIDPRITARLSIHGPSLNDEEHRENESRRKQGEMPEEFLRRQKNEEGDKNRRHGD